MVSFQKNDGGIGMKLEKLFCSRETEEWTFASLTGPWGIMNCLYGRVHHSMWNCIQIFAHMKLTLLGINLPLFPRDRDCLLPC